MDFSPFFSGGASREESASAILAMSLAGVPSFRRFFFGLVAPEEVEALSKREWTVGVEESFVDVRLDAEDVAILIENKIKAASKEPGRPQRPRQLFRYYLGELAREPRKRVIMVYLAPGRTGREEVELVLRSPEFRQRTNDLAVQVSWQELDAYESGNDDVFEKPVRAGLTSVIGSLRSSGGIKHPVVGDRVELVAVHDAVFARLKEGSRIPLLDWRNGDYFHVYTHSVSVTAYVGFEFGVDLATNAPVETIDETGLISVTIRNRCKLRGKKGFPARKHYLDWWRVLAQSSIRTTGGDIYQLDREGWLSLERAIHGTSDELIESISRGGLELYLAIENALATGGLEWRLSKEA